LVFQIRLSPPIPQLDWDIGICLIMAALAYLSAPWSMRVMAERQWRRVVGQMLRR